MHLRAEYQGIITPITYQELTPVKLEEQLKTNPPADSFIGQKSQAINPISQGGRGRMNNPDLEFIRQQHEVFLADLEALAVQALATRDWEAVYTHIATVSDSKIDLSDSFRSGEDFVEALAFINRLLGEASTKDLSRPGAGSFSQPNTIPIRINSIMSSTTNYVADHIDRIERRYGGKESLILNSKWRIASCIDLLYDLNPDGTLTPDQLEHVDTYIAWFKGTEEGQEALAQ